MVISSLVIDTAANAEKRVADRLSAIEGVEVHGNEGNRLIVTIEAESVDASHAVASSFIDIEGVVNINLVYANFEDDPTIGRDRA